MFKNLYKIFFTFLQNFFTISLKLEKNIFNILRNFRKINNLKLPRYFSIIFPELIKNLISNFSYIFEVLRRFCKNILNISIKSFQNISKKFSKFLSNVYIFSKFFNRWYAKRTYRQIITK